MALTPLPPDPPRLRQLAAICRKHLGVRSVFRRKTDLTPNFIRYLTDVSTKVDTYQQRTESVRGGAVWVGRTVGAMDGAIEPPWVRALRLRSTASQAPERTAASGWAGLGVYGVSRSRTQPATSRNAR